MTLYMPLFRSCTRTLTQLHAHLLVTGLHRDPLASTKLIESYARMSPLESARLVFDTFPKPDSFMWAVLIKCYVWNGFFQQAISIYHDMVSKFGQINSYVFPSVLRACSGFDNLVIGQKVHGSIIKFGFESDPVVETALLCMYGETGRLEDARIVFEELSVRDSVSWSAIVGNYVHNGQASEGLEMFRNMVEEGLEIDSVTMLSAAEACGEIREWKSGKSVHGYILRKQILSYGSLERALISMYGKCGNLCSAERLFDHINSRDTSSWTAMITCYNQCGCHKEAIDTFVDMQESNVEPNAVTMMCVLCSCARLGRLREGKSVHGFVIRKMIDPDDDLLGPALIDVYANCGNLKDCLKVFSLTRHINVVSLNMVISGYAQEGQPEESLMLFAQIQKQGTIPDSFTLSSVLSACGNIVFLHLGLQIHCHVIKAGFSNEFVDNSLIDMYSKCGFVNSAYMIFNDTQHSSVVAWNSMICGFSQNGKPTEALNLFDQMYLDCREMDEVTFLSAIQACSSSGYLEKGKWVHHKTIISGESRHTYIETALTDMYAKCGDLQMAQAVFDSMSERSMVSWSVMINGYGMHGRIDDAIPLLNAMVESGIKPNEITFMNILSGCSHSGYVEQGKLYFNLMEKDFGMQPQIEHYACLIDLLSRAGDLDGAYKIIISMPFPADTSIWGALLNGCRIHRRTDMIKVIRKDILNVDLDDTGYYTLLSNIFAEGGDWDEFRTIRSHMKSIGLKKVHGYSAIEIDKRVYRFGANDTSFETVEIGSLLQNLQCLSQDDCHIVEGYDSLVDCSRFL